MGPARDAPDRPAVLVTRPEPEASRLARRLDAAGWRGVATPALERRRLAHLTAQDLVGVQAVVFTSAAAPPLAGADLAAVGAAPPRAFAVGEATAEAADRACFARVSVGPGDAAALLDQIEATLDPSAGAVLVARGREVAVDAAARLARSGFEIRDRILYAAEPAPALTPEARAVVEEGRPFAVLLLSRRTADCFMSQIGSLSVRRGVAVAISAAAAAGLEEARFAAVATAETPRLDAVFRRLTAMFPPKEGPPERVC